MLLEVNGARSPATTQQRQLGSDRGNDSAREASTDTHTSNSNSNRTPIKLASKTGKLPLNRPTFSAPKKSPLSMHTVLKAVTTSRSAGAAEMRHADDHEQSQADDDVMDLSADSTVLSSSSSAVQLRTPHTANNRQVSFTNTQPHLSHHSHQRQRF